MKPQKRTSLRFKFAFFATLLVIGVAASSSYFVRLGQKKAIVEGQEESRNGMVLALRQVARESVLVDDDTIIVNYLNILKQSWMTAYAMVLSSDGKVIAHTDPMLTSKVLDDPITQKALAHRARQSPLEQEVKLPDGRAVLDVALPIMLGSDAASDFKGVVRIGFDKAAIDKFVAESLQENDRRLIAAFLVSLIVGLIGAILLAAVMTKPIRVLREGAIQIGEGKLDHRITVHTNDELKDLADEFNLMADKLSELDRMKQDFVSNVTHELRSPMTSVRGYIDLLLKGVAGDLNELQKDYLSVVKNSSVRLGRFIDNLLDVAKIEAHKLKLTPEEQDLHELGHEMAVLFKPQLEERKIQFVNGISKDTARAFVDKDKLAEVLINLTSNAIKFTPENGTIRLSAKEAANSIELCLEDSGVGIPADMLNTIFNKFEQVKRTQGHTAQKGTGLGLTIAKGIVEAHGGKIWIQSPAPSGKGTAFFFTIPKLTDELKAKLYA